MDKLSQYRNLIKKLLTDFEQYYNRSADPTVEDQPIFDDERGRYILFRSGWWQDRPIRSATIYVQLRNDKIWIEEDRSESGLATHLVKAGVPRDDIVLAFHHPEMRPLTEFAVA